ncbi:MAG: histidine kinase, partial [Flavobacteriales bacterium]|nr:histidine kinase [Flavobacteriales bacterium]
WDKSLNVPAYGLAKQNDSIWYTSKNALHLVTNRQTQNFVFPADKIVNPLLEIVPGGNFLWLRTVSHLYNFNIQTKEFNSIELNRGDLLLNDLLLNEQTLWIASSSGLIKYNLITGNSCLFNKNNGTLQTEILDLAIDTSENVIWLAHSNGATKLKVSTSCEPESGDFTFHINLSSVMFNSSNIALIADTIIDLRDNKISFYVDALDYKRRDSVTFSYKLYKQSTIIQSDSTDRTGIIHFTNLDPGEYSLVLNGNNGIVESSNKVRYQFKIYRPFYLRSWFFIILFALGIGIISLIIVVISRRFRRIEENKLKIKREQLILEHKSLAALMNPHFIFNTLNSIQYFLRNSDQDSAINYITKFSKLIRINFESARKSQVSLHQEIKALELYTYFEKRRLEFSFSFEIIMDPGIRQRNFYVPSLIIQPFVENAIWHGIASVENAIITVDIGLHNEILTVCVCDNGIGFDFTKPISEKSAAIKLARNRIEVLAQMIKCKEEVGVFIENQWPENEKNKGTKVTIKLPIIN